ncbi:hypothetical protein [Streptomyces sp. DT203]|uniref:hypothetical protein n=1 Tax=Streptomyces sp. DT203 TaxID=3393424 RepID=UPI003CF20AEE
MAFDIGNYVALRGTWGHHGQMTSQGGSSGRTWLWGTAVLAGLVMIGLGVYFVRVGLDESNAISGVLGLFVSIIGLAVSVFSVIQGRASLRAASQGQVRMSQHSGSNSTNIQSAGDMQIGNNNRFGSK